MNGTHSPVAQQPNELAEDCFATAYGDVLKDDIGVEKIETRRRKQLQIVKMKETDGTRSEFLAIGISMHEHGSRHIDAYNFPRMVRKSHNQPADATAVVNNSHRPERWVDLCANDTEDVFDVMFATLEELSQ
jgi:hypothetical protein